jgi:hypothetical protein
MPGGSRALGRSHRTGPSPRHIPPIQLSRGRRNLEARVTERRSQRRYLEDTLEELGPRVMTEHAALVGVARGLATAVDAETRVAARQNRAVSAALWRQYREAVAAIAALFAAGDDSSGHAALLRLVDPRQNGQFSSDEAQALGSVTEFSRPYNEEV